MRNIKGITYILLLCVLLSFIAVPAFAAAEDTRSIISASQERVVSVSYRGDTSAYPANSLEAISSASALGADAVSVCVGKTSDGELVLCEDVTLSNVCETSASSLSEITLEDLKKCRLYDNYGVLTDIYPVTLGEALEYLDGSVYLILDISYEDIGDVCAVLSEYDALSEVSLRCKVKSSEAESLGSYAVDVIGVYTGNIIWNSAGHINKLSEAGMSVVEYRTKNYFNVCYGTIVGDNFSADGKARALAAAYDPELCGRRTDDTNGWNELISNGFTVIETNNIAGLCAYISSSEIQKAALSELVAGVGGKDFSAYSELSRKNIGNAFTYAEQVLEGRAKSLGEYEKAYSALLLSLNGKMIAEGKQEAKGALNITAGKIIVVLIIGAAFLAAQIFIEKLKKEKETETEEDYNVRKKESLDNKSEKA